LECGGLTPLCSKPNEKRCQASALQNETATTIHHCVGRFGGHPYSVELPGAEAAAKH
jgi:hypothetical protein